MEKLLSHKLDKILEKIWPKCDKLFAVSIKLIFWCIVLAYLNVFLIKLLPSVPGICNRSSATETESDDLQIQTVPCSGCDLNVRNRRENYKVCFTSLMHSWNRRMAGGSCMIPMGHYGGVGCLALPLARLGPDLFLP